MRSISASTRASGSSISSSRRRCPLSSSAAARGVAQAGQHARVRGGLAGKSGGHAVLGRQRVHRIAAGRGVQKIGGQLAVKAQGLAHAAVLKRKAVKRLCVKGPELRLAVKNRGQTVGVGQIDLLALRKIPAAVRVLCGVEAALQQQRQGAGSTLSGGAAFSAAAGGNALLQTPALHQLVHFQRGQQLCGGRGVTGLADIGGGSVSIGASLRMVPSI